jgi:hypothetical protein
VAYQNLQVPLTTKNGINYNLQYDRTNGNVQVIQQNAPAGTQPIFQNGRFTSGASSAGFSSVDQQSLYGNIQSSVRGAYTTGGGTGSGLVLPQWAQSSNQGNASGQTSTTPSPPVSGTSGSGGIGQFFSDLLNPISVLQGYNNPNSFGYVGENFGNIVYPEDILRDNQDIFVISQYRYVPPDAGALLGGQNSFTNILQNGLTRGSDFESGTNQLLGTIYLPMPSTVMDSNNVSWGPDSLDNLSAAVMANVMGNTGQYLAAGGIGGAAGALFGSPGSGINAGTLTKTVLDAVGTGGIKPGSDISALIDASVQSRILKAAQFNIPTQTILGRSSGIVPNNNLELLFNSPVLRQFSFAYRMTARSETEASNIRKIINSFKKGMAPKKSDAGAGGFFLKTPNIFRLSYQCSGQEIDGVNKFKTCALQSFSCNYTPDGFWAAYDKGQPVSVSMSMQFSELEPIYDTDYSSTSISTNAVGY